MDKAQYWDNVYQTKSPDQVSWTQTIPTTSLSFIASFNLPLSAKIIDIGGGDCFLVDHLLELGYQNISVLDISAEAIEKAKKRLGLKANKVTWHVSDITSFIPDHKYDLWHDRATFHFLITENDIKKYLYTVASFTSNMILSTFSDNGPTKCSGLEIKQYNETSLENQLSKSFEKIECLIEDHTTPFETTQNFIFCSFKKKQ